MDQSASLPIFLLLLLGICLNARSQDSLTNKHLQLSLGYQHLRMMDKNVSPLVYASNNGQLQVGFTKEKKSNRWWIVTCVSVGSNQSSRFGKREATVFDDFDIHGERDSTLYELNPTLSYLGINLEFDFSKARRGFGSKVYYGFKILERYQYSALGADTWFVNQISLMPSLHIGIIEKKRSQLVCNISFPLLSNIVRQPFAYDPSLPEKSYFKAYLKTGSFFTSINQLQQLNTSLTSEHKLSNEHHLGVLFQFNWTRLSNIQDGHYTAYSNSLSVYYEF